LSANLEIGSVLTGADTERAGSLETLVLGPNSFYAAENYVLSLFQLYPNVYFHKATKAAECVFSALMLRVGMCVADDSGDATGLPSRHPIRRFFGDPDSLANVLALDDTVLWGALPMMVEAEDRAVAGFAQQLINRHLPKCVDVRQCFEQKIPPTPNADRKERAERSAEIALHCNNVLAAFEEESRSASLGATFIDRDRRTPYKKFQDSQSLLNQILIRQGTEYVDMAELSPVVAGAESFEVCRVYIGEGDNTARKVVREHNRNRTWWRGLRYGFPCRASESCEIRTRCWRRPSWPHPVAEGLLSYSAGGICRGL